MSEIEPKNHFYKYKAGFQLFRMSKYEQALEFYKESLQIYEQRDKPSKGELATLHLLIGDCYRGLGQNQSAIDEYKEALKVDPSSENQQKYRTRIKEIKYPVRKRKSNNNIFNGEYPTILGILFDITSIILLIYGSMLPLINFNVTINGTVFKNVSLDIFSFSYELGAQIIFSLILLSMIVFLILDLMVILLHKQGASNSILKHYEGADPKPLSVILTTIIFLLISYGEVLDYSPISHSIDKSTEHAGVGLFIIISAMTVYFFRAHVQTN